MSSLAFSGSFKYLCYGSTANRNIFILSVWGLSLDVCKMVPALKGLSSLSLCEAIVGLSED